MFEMGSKTESWSQKGLTNNVFAMSAMVSDNKPQRLGQGEPPNVNRRATKSRLS